MDSNRVKVKGCIEVGINQHSLQEYIDAGFTFWLQMETENSKLPIHIKLNVQALKASLTVYSNVAAIGKADFDEMEVNITHFKTLEKTLL